MCANYLISAQKKNLKNILKDVRKDGLHKIKFINVDRVVSSSGGELNPITNEPTDPWGKPGGDEGFNETITSSYIYGTVSFFDTSQAFRQFYRTGTFDKGTVGVVTDFDDSFNNVGQNKFLQADYIAIGTGIEKYEVRVSVRGNFELSVKTILKKVT